MLDWLVNNNVKDENSKLKDMIYALQNELDIKIQENEAVHINMFETKHEYDAKFTKLENDIDKLRLSLHEKINELNDISNKNNDLNMENKNIEGKLKQQIEAFNSISNEYVQEKRKWEIKRESLEKEINSNTRLITNIIPINEYKCRDINLYNRDLDINVDKYKEQLRFINGVLNSLTESVNQLDPFIDNLIDRMNFLFSNTELKKEHKGYIFACDKLRMHLFGLQQIVRAVFIFGKMINKSVGKENVLNLNILLLLINKFVTYLEIVFKYYKIFLLEDKKVSCESDSDLFSNKMKINKDLKINLDSFISVFKNFIRLINNCFNFDLNYNTRMISIISDNTAMLAFKLNEKYFINYPRRFPVYDYHTLFTKLNEYSTIIKSRFNDLYKFFEIKLEIEYKNFEFIKEENKNKYNYPMINLHTLRSNNDTIRKNIKEVCTAFESFNQYITKLSTFLHSTWNTDKDILINIYDKYQRDYFLKDMNKIIIDDYKKSEEGVNYEEAIQNRRILRELLEKENSFSRDRENYKNKVIEYEDDIRRLYKKLEEEKNNYDLIMIEKNNLEIKMSKIKERGFVDEECNETISKSTAVTPDPQFIEYLKNSTDILSIEDEILSDDVESGKQRSSFKLSDTDSKCIPLSRLSSQVDVNKDISILYHQKIIEKFKRYSAKVRNIDIKVLANSHNEDIRHEYEVRLLEIEKKYQEEMKAKDENLVNIEDLRNGFDQQFQYLSQLVADHSTELTTIKDRIKDCTRCKVYIR